MSSFSWTLASRPRKTDGHHSKHTLWRALIFSVFLLWHTYFVWFQNRGVARYIFTSVHLKSLALGVTTILFSKPQLGESPSLVLDNWWIWDRLVHPSCGAWWHSSDGDDHIKWWDGHVWWWSSAPSWKRRKRKTKPYGDQGKGINRDFVSVIKTL